MTENRILKFSEHLLVYAGAINTGIIRDGGQALVIDCGDGGVAAVFPTLGVGTIDLMLFTHHHRDQACGAAHFIAQGARTGVPAAERQWFEDPSALWNDPKRRWNLYNFH